MGGTTTAISENEWALPKALPDPTRCFSLLCLTIMCVRHYMATGDPSATMFGLFLNPFVVFYLATAAATVYYAKKSKNLPSTTSDLWTAEWYWWNGWLFHAVFDGSAGSLRLVPVVVHQYDVLDMRFPTHHTVPYVIGLFELLVMYPLCLLTVRAVLQKSPYRFPLELITSTFQLMGMVLFVGAELYEGQVHVPALDPVGLSPDNMWANVKFFYMYHFTYYW